MGQRKIQHGPKKNICLCTKSASHNHDPPPTRVDFAEECWVAEEAVEGGWQDRRGGYCASYSPREEGGVFVAASA